MWNSERARACATGVVVAATMTSTSPNAGAQAAVPPPPPAAVAPAASPPTSSPAPPRPRTAPVWGGASLFALSYVVSAFSAATGYGADDGTVSSRAAMWVPLVGPFVTLGSSRSAGAGALLVLDGLAQIGGVALFVGGLAASAPRVLPPDATRPATLAIAPLVDPRAAGASVVGTF